MFYLCVRSILRFAEVVYSSVEIVANLRYIVYTVYEQCFSLSACGARQMTEEWGELNINWHLEAFGAFYTPFWADYGDTSIVC
jgi:hypothetical protein